MKARLSVNKISNISVDVDRLKKACPHGIYQNHQCMSVEEFLQKFTFTEDEKIYPIQSTRDIASP